MFVSRPKPQIVHTAESLAALVLSHDDQTEALIQAVDWSYVGPFGRKQSVADIIADCVAEIEAEDASVVVPEEAIEGAWGLVDDAAAARLYQRQDEQAAYERSLGEPAEYESERSGGWNSL